MDITQVHVAQKAVLTNPSEIILARSRHDLLESLLDSLKVRVKIRNSTFLKGQFELESSVRGGDVATWNRLKNSLPGIRSEPRDSCVGVVKIE